MIERESRPVVALPAPDEETVELEGDEEWLSTVDEPGTAGTGGGAAPSGKVL